MCCLKKVIVGKREASWGGDAVGVEAERKRGTFVDRGENDEIFNAIHFRWRT